MVSSRLATHIQIFIERSRILVEVLAGTKLRGIDENGHHHDIGLGCGQLDEVDVPLMQCAHRRDEPEGLACGAAIAGELLHG